MTIGNSVTTIGNYAFNGCTGLTSVTIGNSVTSIGDQAFDGCSGLKKVVSMNVMPPTVASIYAFSLTIYSGCQLIVPKNSLEFYKAARVWTSFTNICLFGDADNDGSVTRNDAIAVMNYYLGENNDIDTEAADVNGDGKVTMADANEVMNIYLGK